MKIALLADWLDFGYMGLGTYTFHLISSLLDIDRENEYVVVHNESSRCPEDKKKIFGRTREIIIKLPYKFTNRYIYELLFTKRKYPRVLEREGFDIVHDSNIFGVIPPRKYRFKVVITVHDMSLYSPDLLRKVTKIIVLLTAKKILKSEMSFHFISSSNYTKKEMVYCAKIPDEMISVIYDGVNHQVFRQMKIYDPPISGPFILYVGSATPRKNLPMLFEAFYKLKKGEAPIPHKMVVVSNLSRKYVELIKRLNLQKEIIVKPCVKTDELVKLYNTADLFVLPSFYEGFGLTILEAMACGCPVAASNAASLPEVVGSAGKLFNPFSVDSIANAILDILTDDALREELKRKGLERAKLFDWEITAKKTLDIYRRIYED